MTPVLFPILKSFALHYACLGWIGECCSWFLMVLFDRLACPTLVQLSPPLYRSRFRVHSASRDLNSTRNDGKSQQNQE